ncbi:MAG: hypothetical protein WAM14_04780 [Candidatus Nitrosopolaris sp.]
MEEEIPIILIGVSLRQRTPMHDYYTSSSSQQKQQTEKQIPLIEKNILEETNYEQL